MYDTLMYVKKLEAVGVPRLQAEVQAEAMREFVDSNFATKQDLKNLSAELRLEIQKATITYGKMLVAAVTVMIAAMGIMLKL